MPTLTKVTSANGASANVNQTYAGNFQGFINKLESSGYSVNVAGGYNYRNIAGTNTLSNHALGNAIDINPYSNSNVFGGRGAGNNFPDNVGGMAKEYGLKWGGEWNNPDSMHFEVRPGVDPMSITERQTTYAPADYSSDLQGKFSNTDFSNNNQTGSFNVEDGPSYQPDGASLTTGSTWSDGTPVGDMIKDTPSDTGSGPLVIDVKKQADDGSLDGDSVTDPKAGAQGNAKNVPIAIVTTGNQQANATTAAAKAQAEAALKAADTTTKSDTKLQSEQQGWASNWAVRIFLFIIGAIFIAGALFLFGGQAIFQAKSPAR